MPNIKGAAALNMALTAISVPPSFFSTQKMAGYPLGSRSKDKVLGGKFAVKMGAKCPKFTGQLPKICLKRPNEYYHHFSRPKKWPGTNFDP